MPRPGDKAPDVTPMEEPIKVEAEKRPPKEWRTPDAAAPKGGWRRVAGHYDVATDTFTHEPMIGPKREELLSRAVGERVVVRAKKTAATDGTPLFDPAVVERLAATWPSMFAASISGRPVRVPLKREAKKGFGAVRQIVTYAEIDPDGTGPMPVDVACDLVSRYPMFLEIVEE